MSLCCSGSQRAAAADDSALDVSGDQATPTEATTVGDGSENAASPPADAEDDGDEEGAGDASGPSTATVTLDGQTYNFTSEDAVVAQCLTDLFGIFSVQLLTADGDGSVQIMILHDDTDPAVVEQVNSVNFSVGDEDWVADESSELFGMSDDLQPGMSQVDSAEVDGRTVRGTATFVSQMGVYGGEVETATGTFEATCVEERVS